MSKDHFFCGIGGSGMLPLAMIVQSRGVTIAGSDRSRDQGRTPAKFAWLEAHGVTLFPQDGSGVTSPDQVVIASGAVEDTVPDIAAAKAVDATIKTRPELLSELFNAAPTSVGVAGTSGKSTITGMIAWMLDQAGRDPTVMNGAVMKNFVDADHPFASARIGSPALFVSEVDESDGSIARYDPTVAVVSNISLDHKAMDELRTLFGDFARRAEVAVLNLDNGETAALAADPALGKVLTFSVGKAQAHLSAQALTPTPTGMTFDLHCEGRVLPVQLAVPGAHNVANALAALAAVKALGVDLDAAVAALAHFRGIRRRMEVVGTRNDVTVIDDFGHNPDKITASLQTLLAFPGRLLILFQPQGYGPLKLMRREFVDVFARLMQTDDILIMPDPVYQGGTTDRSVGSSDIIADLNAAARTGEYVGDRSAAGDRLLALARPGDRILIMGARDDTLSEFAADILARL